MTANEPKEEVSIEIELIESILREISSIPLI